MINWKDIRKKNFSIKTKNKKKKDKFIIDFLKIYKYKGKIYEQQKDSDGFRRI